MAGSNQSQNLYGLLSGLTGAFNQEDMGQGMMFAQNIRDYNAPVLDANDPNSVLDRQRWAQRNGYQNEAVALGSTLGQLNKQQQMQDDKAEYYRMVNAMSQLEDQRQKALQGLTVPGGGPPSPQQVAEVNANFDRARDKLAFRIDEYAAKVEGASGTAGADAVRQGKMARAMESALINNGLSAYKELAPFMTPENLKDLVEEKNTLGALNVQRSQVYDNGTMMAVTEDGQAFLIAPGENGGKPVFSDHPDYERLSAEASASGLTATAAEAQARQDIKDKALQEREADARLIQYQADMGATDFAIEQTQQLLEAYENGAVDSGPFQGLLVKLGLGDRAMGELNAQAIYQALMNLQITRLTPVTEKELELISQLWASAGQNPEQAMGALSAALGRLVNLHNRNREMVIRDTRILSGSDRSFRQGSGEYYSDCFTGKYGENFYDQEIPQYFGGEGVNLSPGGGNTIGGPLDPPSGDILDEADAFLQRNKGRKP